MNPNEAPKACGDGCSCACGHHWVAPTAIILIGVAVLLGNLGWLGSNAVGIAWPVLLIIAAATKFCRCCGCK